MSTYLVAFVVCDYTYKEAKTPRGTTVSLCFLIRSHFQAYFHPSQYLSSKQCESRTAPFFYMARSIKLLSEVIAIIQN